MTRETFLAALREGLEGLPADTVADVVGEYEAHIEEAQSRGRPEAEVVAALGDPVRLARELRAEIRVRRWEVKRDPAAAFQAISALVALGAANLALIVPLLAVGAAVLAALVLTGLGVIGFAALLLAGALSHTPQIAVALREFFALAAADVPTAALLALSLSAGAVANIAAALLIAAAIVKAAIWYGRLNYRMVRPPPRHAVVSHAAKLTVIGS